MTALQFILNNYCLASFSKSAGQFCARATEKDPAFPWHCLNESTPITVCCSLLMIHTFSKYFVQSTSQLSIPLTFKCNYLLIFWTFCSIQLLLLHAVVATAGTEACLTPSWGKSPFCFEKPRFFHNAEGGTTLWPPPLPVPEPLPSGTKRGCQQQQAPARASEH